MRLDVTGGELRNKQGVTTGWHNLECPDCGQHGAIIHMDRSSQSKLLTWKGQCACGFEIPDLGKEGTLRSAVAEWKQLCRAAQQVKQQLLGEQAVKQEQQLELNITAFLGVVDWMDPIENLPEMSGWYDVRFKMSDEERAERGEDHVRRWWHGDAECWSWPVQVGNSTEEEEAAARGRLARMDLTLALEWRGLKEQHPDLRLRRR